MAKAKLSDAEGKGILLRWPGRTRKLWHTPEGIGYWVRAQPKPLHKAAASPVISVPGASLFTTQPDGMWAFLSDTAFADVIAIEVCGSSQNLNDKRSRYAATVRSLVLDCPLPWLLEEIALPKGGQAPRWEACRSISRKPRTNLVVPVRYLRALFTIPNALYVDWVPNNVADGHEFFCRHSSLDSYTSQTMQKFLRQMAPSAHFYTRPAT